MAGKRIRGLALIASFTAMVQMTWPGQEAVAAQSTDPLWPCVQRKVPEVSSGMIWAGPAVDGLQGAWRDDPVVTDLAARIAQRRTPLEDAKVLVQDFAASLGADKDRKLTLLFVGMLATINRERGSIISGIGRYAQRQTQLAEKIERTFAELGALPVKGNLEDEARREELEDIQVWDTRIYEERERSLGYICDQPVRLERRAFALAREIMTHLE